MITNAPRTFGKRGRLPDLDDFGPSRSPSGKTRDGGSAETAKAAPAFGRPIAATLVPVLEVPESTAPALSDDALVELAAALRAEGFFDRRVRQGRVPTSMRAGLFTGIIVSFVQAGIVIVHIQKDPGGGVAQALALAGINEHAATPWLIAGSLWMGVEAAASIILGVHWLLRRFAIDSFMAYGLGGAVMSGALAMIQETLGFGAPRDGYWLEIATGLGAGLCYRLFAGNRA